MDQQVSFTQLHILAGQNGWHVELHTGKRHTVRPNENYLEMVFIRCKHPESGLVLSQQINKGDLESAADILLEKLRSVCD
jgi:hypothetical protein